MPGVRPSALASKLRTGSRCTASSRVCARPSTSSNQHGFKGQDALYDPADFRALIEQRDEIHEQRAQTTWECPLNTLKEASKTVGDNGEHEPASSQADMNSTF